MTALTYVAVTPARDEVENLQRLADALMQQKLLPLQWLIVDNGSTDGTIELADELAAAHDWISVLSVPNDRTRPGPPVVRAFNAGLAALERTADVIVKLDADVSFDADYFHDMLALFEREPRLGVASGVCWEAKDGVWRPLHVTGGHVRGATRAYRRACLEDIGALPEVFGWDGVDELKAAVLGWETRCLAEIRFFHHRAVGERDGAARARWLAEGRCCYYMGYRVSYMLARTFGRAIRDRDAAALVMPWAFARAAIRREDRYPDESVRRYLRSQQGLRMLPLRLAESFNGRRA